MEHKEVFSQNLKKYMALNGKSRRDVCDALGYSYFTFSDWVNGKKMPRMDKVEQLANYFGIKKSDLIEETKKAAPEHGSGQSEAKMKLFDLAENCTEEEAERLVQMMELFLGKK
jgi:transcriptional regulator with XRE-family HTH domain